MSYYGCNIYVFVLMAGDSRGFDSHDRQSIQLVEILVRSLQCLFP